MSGRLWTTLCVSVNVRHLPSVSAFSGEAALSETYDDFYSRVAVLSSKGATLLYPRLTPLDLPQPKLLCVWTRAMAGLLSLTVMQHSLCVSSQTCLRLRMPLPQLRTLVRVQPWKWFHPVSPLIAGRICAWSSRVLSRKVFLTLWTYWNPPYMTQMWFPAPRKHPWILFLTMARTGTPATRNGAGRSSQEGEKGPHTTCVLPGFNNCVFL